MHQFIPFIKFHVPCLCKINVLLNYKCIGNFGEMQYSPMSRCSLAHRSHPNSLVCPLVSRCVLLSFSILFSLNICVWNRVIDGLVHFFCSLVCNFTCLHSEFRFTSTNFLYSIEQCSSENKWMPFKLAREMMPLIRMINIP